MNKQEQLFETARTLAPQFETDLSTGLVVVDDVSRPYVVGGVKAIQALKNAVPFAIVTEPYGNGYDFTARVAQ